jgi:hypothetical protein
MRPLRVFYRSALLFLLRASTIIFFLVALAVSTVPPINAQSIPFNGPRDYLVGGSPQSVVVGDFNGDGRPDIATANWITNNISVLLQNSDGSFQSVINYPVGNQPASIQVGDVNNDGKLDLVVVNTTDGTIGVLLGNGDGTFQAQKLTTLSGAFPSLVIADFNGDGKLDLAVGVPTPQVNTSALAVLLGNGDGTFQAPVNYPVNAAPHVLAAADFNKDGKLDLVTLGQGVLVLLGNGDGTFQAPINTPLSQPDGLVVADFNQDGNLDIATTSIPSLGFPSLTLLLGNGDGTFQVNVLSQTYIEPFAAGDLNGDGKPDLITETTVGPAIVETLLNNGDGTFTAGQSLPTAAEVSESALSIVLSDLNGNQKLDLVVASSNTETNAGTLPDIVSVVYGNGDGSFANFPSYPASLATPGGSPPGSVGTPVVGDFNGDGKPDLAVPIFTVGRSYYVEISTLLNDGEGFAPPIVTQLANLMSPLSPIYMSSGDFNGDGKLDMALTGSVGPFNETTGISILLGNGDGTYQSATTYGAEMTGPIAVADFNKDGNLDVIGVITSPSASLSVLLGNGNGTFGFPVNTSVVGSVIAFAIGDFNNDGKPDVAALLNSSGVEQLAMFFGNGDGTFTAGPTYNVGLNPTAIATGDMNGDGILDLIVGNSIGFVVDNPAPSSVSVLLGNGNGTFQSPIVTTAGNGISSIAVADFNLDGKPDVVIGNAGWTDISLLLGNGDGTLQAPTQFYVNNIFDTGGLYDALAVADFDGNGSPDVAVGGQNGVTLLLNTLGTGGPAALLSANALGFGNDTVGQTSPPQTATLSYWASTALTIASITLSGPQSGDYQQTNTCGTKLATGTNCTITVTFTPQAAGARTAAIQITDNAINSPQTIALTGTGLNLGLAVPSGSSSSATVSAGQTATYTLAIGGEGISGAASFTCTGAPQGASCSPPATVNVSATSVSTLTVTVTTTSRTLAAARPAERIPPGWWAIAMFVFVILPKAARRGRRGLRLLPLVLLFMCSCGGNNSGGPRINPNGTPAGTYTLTLSATSGATSQSMPLTLNVQ